jgi:hypothetical protein
VREEGAQGAPDTRHWSERETERRSGAARTRPRAEGEQRDGQGRERDPLRPLFRGFSRPRNDDGARSGSSGDAARPRGGEGRPEWSRPRRDDGGGSRPRGESGGGVSRPRPESGGGAQRATPPPSSSPRNEPQRERAQPREGNERREGARRRPH